MLIYNELARKRAEISFNSIIRWLVIHLTILFTNKFDFRPSNSFRSLIRCIVLHLVIILRINSNKLEFLATNSSRSIIRRILDASRQIYKIDLLDFSATNSYDLIVRCIPMHFTSLFTNNKSIFFSSFSFSIFLHPIRPIRRYDGSRLTFMITLPANKVDRFLFDFHISRSRFRLIIRPSGTNEEPVRNSFPLCTDCHFLSLTEIVLLVDGLLGSVIRYYLMEKEIKMDDCYNIFLSYYQHILFNKKYLFLFSSS